MRPTFALRLAAAITTAILATACNDATGPDDDGNGSNVPLVGPANLRAVATTATSIRVIFSPVQGATAYRIDRATTGQPVTELGTTNTFYFDDTGLTPGRFYEYQVTPLRGSEVGPTSGWAQVTLPEAGSRQSVLVGPITQNRTLTADSQYVIYRVAKVMRGATLTIQPGTRIVGDTLAPQALLLVGRGARIMAQGTAQNPIVFTSQRPWGQRNPGDWGGIAIVGNARTNLGSEAFADAPPEYREPYSGGTDDNDDSGVLRYVRIEFAGHPDEAGRPQNALTLLAVGRGTTIEYVQVLGALEDAYKWFGGTVDSRYLVSYEVGDDHFDVSQGYRGRNQFILALRTRRLVTDQPGSGANRLTFEIDGCEPDFTPCAANRNPRSLPIFANFSVVDTRPQNFSQGWSGGALFRDAGGGILVNGTMVNLLNYAVTISDQPSDEMRRRDSLALYNLLLANPENFAPGYADRGNWTGKNLEESSRTFSELFVGMPASPDPAGDPRINWRPSQGSPLATGGLTAFSGPLASLAGGFVTPTSYRGAAAPGGPDWWATWTVYYLR